MSTEGLFDNFVQNLQLPFFFKKVALSLTG